MKFYVTCGGVREIIIADSSEKAAIELTLRFGKNSKIDNRIVVSERGFDIHDDDETFDLRKMMRKGGYDL